MVIIDVELKSVKYLSSLLIRTLGIFQIRAAFIVGFLLLRSMFNRGRGGPVELLFVSSTELIV